MSDWQQDPQAQRLIDAQAAVLGSMLIDSSCIADVLAKVNAQMFVSSTYRTIYGAIRDLFHAARRTTIRSLSSWPR